MRVERRRTDRVTLTVPVRVRGVDEFGSESVDTKAHFWGLYFPPLPPNGLADSKVALECRRCHQPQALRLSIVEVDVLESSGNLPWACSVCRVITPWGYPEKDRKMPGDGENVPG